MARRKRKFTSGRGYKHDPRDLKLRGGDSDRMYRYWPDHQWFGDQGTTPFCVGYGWAHWLHASPVTNYIDPAGIYYFAKYIDEWQGEEYDGTSVRAGVKVLHKLGFVESYAFTRDMDTLVYTLLEKGPVVIGVDWYEGFMKPSYEGLIEPTGEVLGGHCCVLTGVNVIDGLFRGKNSWGYDYGRHGRFSVTFDTMRLLMANRGEVCCAVERKGEPEQP